MAAAGRSGTLRCVLISSTDPRWLRTALDQLDEVLVDHAHCEKKAAATALSLMGAYPDREHLVRRMSALAIEELRHFRDVYERISELVYAHAGIKRKVPVADTTAGAASSVPEAADLKPEDADLKE